MAAPASRRAGGGRRRHHRLHGRRRRRRSRRASRRWSRRSAPALMISSSARARAASASPAAWPGTSSRPGLLAGFGMRLLYGVRYTDMCAFRAIRRDALLDLGMREMTYGWNIEMQMRAARAGPAHSRNSGALSLPQRRRLQGRGQPARHHPRRRASSRPSCASRPSPHRRGARRAEGVGPAALTTRGEGQRRGFSWHRRSMWCSARSPRRRSGPVSASRSPAASCPRRWRGRWRRSTAGRCRARSRCRSSRSSAYPRPPSVLAALALPQPGRAVGARRPPSPRKRGASTSISKDAPRRVLVPLALARRRTGPSHAAYSPAVVGLIFGAALLAIVPAAAMLPKFSGDRSCSRRRSSITPRLR